jgi:hypothetical protein
MTKFSSLALAGVAFLGLAVNAAADSLDRTGSLLVFPWYDNTRAGHFYVTVTNTNADFTPTSLTLFAGTVDVEYIYINGGNCLEFNRTRRLTPNDTLTVETRLDNPNATEGYLYAFAKSPTTGQAIKFDWLAGDSFIVAPDVIGAVDIPAIVYKAGAGIAAGGVTNLDSDSVRDLNGLEYEQTRDELIVPRFISDRLLFSSPELILVGLTGQSFTTIVNFLVYNDNEEVFSTQYAFDCWTRVRLAHISGIFTDDFLDSTNNASGENILGVPFLGSVETGWFRMDGAVATSTASTVQDPAFLAVRLERVAVGVSAVASLPYGVGEQSNGDLVTHGPFADTN